MRNLASRRLIQWIHSGRPFTRTFFVGRLETAGAGCGTERQGFIASMGTCTPRGGLRLPTKSSIEMVFARDMTRSVAQGPGENLLKLCLCEEHQFSSSAPPNV